MSLDSNLQDLRASMQRDKRAIVLTGLDSYLGYSLIHTPVRTANLLLQNEASLLSDTYQKVVIN